MTELSVVEDYLLRGKYPDGFSKAEKANLRRKCRNNFVMDKGVLHYKAAIPEVWKCSYCTKRQVNIRQKPMEFQTKFPAAKRQRLLN